MISGTSRLHEFCRTIVSQKFVKGSRSIKLKSWRVRSESLYTRLGVSETASREEIRRAYRTLARKHHPDVDNSKNAEKKFMEIKAAYELLSDEYRRSSYDRRLKASRYNDPNISEEIWGRANGKSGDYFRNYAYADFMDELRREENSKRGKKYGQESSQRKSYSSERSNTSRYREPWFPSGSEFAENWHSINWNFIILFIWLTTIVFCSLGPSSARNVLVGFLLLSWKPIGFKVSAIFASYLSGLGGFYLAATATFLSIFIGNKIHKLVALLSTVVFVRLKYRVSVLLVPLLMLFASTLVRIGEGVVWD